MIKGEIFIPKMPSIKITKLIQAVHPQAKMKKTLELDREKKLMNY